MTVTIAFPLTDKQATSIIVAADRFGVEPWEMAAHVLKIRTDIRELRKARP